MSHLKIGDRVRPTERALSTLDPLTRVNWRGALGEIAEFSGFSVGVRRDQSTETWWFRAEDLELVPPGEVERTKGLADSMARPHPLTPSQALDELAAESQRLGLYDYPKAVPVFYLLAHPDGSPCYTAGLTLMHDEESVRALAGNRASCPKEHVPLKYVFARPGSAPTS